MLSPGKKNRVIESKTLPVITLIGLIFGDKAIGDKARKYTTEAQRHGEMQKSLKRRGGEDAEAFIGKY